MLCGGLRRQPNDVGAFARGQMTVDSVIPAGVGTILSREIRSRGADGSRVVRASHALLALTAIGAGNREVDSVWFNAGLRPFDPLPCGVNMQVFHDFRLLAANLARDLDGLIHKMNISMQKSRCRELPLYLPRVPASLIRRGLRKSDIKSSNLVMIRFLFHMKVPTEQDKCAEMSTICDDLPAE